MKATIPDRVVPPGQLAPDRFETASVDAMSGDRTVREDAGRPAAPATVGRSPFVPPRWFVVTFWRAHRALVRGTRGRVGLWRPKADRWGALWLTTTGWRSGRTRHVLLGYFEDGDNYVTMAMNGWFAPEPAWWLNLQADPDATVRTRDGIRQVRARRAAGAERERLWARWREIDKNLDEYAARRPHDTAVVVFEPAIAASPAASATAADAAADSSTGGA
jgi:deazaflavin-dependent oxidoreductase (nitroreductase family)